MTDDASGGLHAPINPDTSEHAASEAAAFARSRGSGVSSTDGSGLFRLLVESVRDYAIFALDPDGCVLSWNAGAERFKGYKAEEIIGQHFSVFYTEEDKAARKPEYELVVAIRDGRVEDEGWRVRKDGTMFWANVVITALRDETGTLVGFAKVTRDLNERRAAELEAVDSARRLAKAEEANRVKSGFLAAMSHELRTPLNAISGYADLLLAGIGGALAPQQRDYVARMKASQQHLLSIINDILNFSRLEAGQIEYDITDVPLDAVVDQVALMIEPQAALKGIELVREPCKGLVMRADRAKVEQILLNLLSNAVKFTQEGGEVRISCSADAATTSLSVADTGVGIPESELGKIFEPFIQVGRNLTSMHEGTGLGLAISSDLARGMGGTLTVRSTVGSGSSFVLTLPSA